MRKLRLTGISAFALGLSLGLLPPAAAQVAPSSFVQPTENPEADELASQMRVLASEPTNVAALVRAAEITTDLGDLTAAKGFLDRASRILPNDARMKAAQGSWLVASERPGEALQRFGEAERLGWPVRSFAARRALAWDLVGQQGRAQRDYKVALANGRDDETQRRYALSLAIAGQRDAALDLIDAQLRRSDRAAWRTRAFILALAGDQPGATRISTSMMPANMVAGMQAFFSRLPTMTPAEKAFAVHFGELRATPERLADARFVPVVPQLAVEVAPTRAAPVITPVQVAAAQSKRDKKGRKQKVGRTALANAGQGAVQPASLPSAPAYAAASPSAYPAPVQPASGGMRAPGAVARQSYGAALPAEQNVRVAAIPSGVAGPRTPLGAYSPPAARVGAPTTTASPAYAPWQGVPATGASRPGTAYAPQSGAAQVAASPRSFAPRAPSPTVNPQPFGAASATPAAPQVAAAQGNAALPTMANAPSPQIAANTATAAPAQRWPAAPVQVAGAAPQQPATAGAQPGAGVTAAPVAQTFAAPSGQRVAAPNGAPAAASAGIAPPTYASAVQALASAPAPAAETDTRVVASAPTPASGIAVETVPPSAVAAAGAGAPAPGTATAATSEEAVIARIVAGQDTARSVLSRPAPTRVAGAPVRPQADAAQASSRPTTPTPAHRAPVKLAPAEAPTARAGSAASARRGDTAQLEARDARAARGQREVTDAQETAPTRSRALASARTRRGVVAAEEEAPPAKTVASRGKRPVTNGDEEAAPAKSKALASVRGRRGAVPVDAEEPLPAKGKAPASVRGARGTAPADTEEEVAPAKGKALAATRGKRGVAAAEEQPGPARGKLAAAKIKKPAAKAEPERYWVQVAGGANPGDLTKAWKKAQGANPALKGRQGYATPLRATNRVLTGPFKSQEEAQAFVNKLAGTGTSAFTFTSNAGQKVDKLPTP